MDDEDDRNSTQRSSLSERNLEIGSQDEEYNSDTDNRTASKLLQRQQKLEELALGNKIPAIETAGVEPFTIKCICGFLHDDGNTSYCEKCGTWQHIECYHPDAMEDAPFEHSCADCQPRPLDRNQANKQQRYLRQIYTNSGTSISKTSPRPKAGRLSTKQHWN
jgi:hypothetical protein